MKAKKKPEYEAFVRLTDALLSVPHAQIHKEQVEEHRKEAENNPKKRGPKPKGKK